MSTTKLDHDPTAGAAPAFALLRVWHVEVLSSVAARPDAMMPPTRTSYAIAPSTWRDLPDEELARRVSVLVEASYARRNRQMATTGDPTPTWPIGFVCEWVAADATPASAPQDAPVTLFSHPIAGAVVARGIAELQKVRVSARPGLSERPWTTAFSAWRIEPNEDWKVLGHAERAAAFAPLG